MKGVLESIDYMYGTYFQRILEKLKPEIEEKGNLKAMILSR